MQDEITISVINGDAQLVIIDIFLNVINSKKDILIFGKAHICSLAQIYGKPYKANDSEYDGSPDPVVVVAAISLKFLIGQQRYFEYELTHHINELFHENLEQKFALNFVGGNSLIQNITGVLSWSNWFPCLLWMFIGHPMMSWYGCLM